MIGWIFVYNKLGGTNNYSNDLYDNINYTDNCFMGSKFLQKFEKDKVFYDNEEFFVCLNGFILNKAFYTEQYPNLNWSEIIIILYKEDKNFFKKFKGSFCGFIFDKNVNKVIAFTDQLGTRSLFYFYNDDYFVIAESFNYLLDFLIINQVEYTFNDRAVEYMITYGSMLDDCTFVKEINRILYGHYIQFSENSFEIIQYKKFTTKNQLDLSEREAIELLEKTFTDALESEIKKNEEYGYKHLMDLSGGLDARTINYVAKDMGISNITNLHFSQMGSDEYLISEKLAKELKNSYMYFSLDNASHLFDVDNIVLLNYGLQYYPAIGANYKILKSQNNNEFGIKITGLLGDIHDGSFSTNTYQEKSYFDKLYKFNQSYSFDIDSSVFQKFDTLEEFRFHTRGLLFGLTTSFITQNYLETFSPFCDEDFLDLSFNISLKMRVGNHIFRKWVNDKHKSAMMIKYDSTYCKPMRNDLLVKIFNKIRKSFKKYMYICHLSNKDYQENNMNPMDYWLNTNKQLNEFIENYLESNIFDTKNSELNDELKRIINKGNVVEKTSLMTAESVYKQYFEEKDKFHDLLLKYK